MWRYLKPAGNAPAAWSLAPGDQAPHVLTDSFGRPAISCTTTGFCAAVSGTQASTYDPATQAWTMARPDSSNANLDSVSCISSSFCVAVDEQGSYTTWNGAGWSGMASFDASATGALAQSVSCLSPTLCVASGGDGNAEIYNGAGWTSTSLDPGGLSNPSCVQQTTNRPEYCAVSGPSNMYYMESEGGTPTWSGAQALPDNNGDVVNALGCGPSLCVAIGAQNHAWTGTP